MLRRLSVSRPLVQKHQFWEVPAQVPTVSGGEAVGLGLGVGGDQEVGDQMLAWAAVFAIPPEGLTGEP